MYYSLQIKINPKLSYDGFYTQGDYVSGSVILSVPPPNKSSLKQNTPPKKLDISSVQISLVASKHIKVNVPPSLQSFISTGGWALDGENEYQLFSGYKPTEQSDSTYFSVSQVLYNSLKLDEKLKPGNTYTFPFEFQYPEDRLLIPYLVQADKHEISSHRLEVTVTNGPDEKILHNSDPIFYIIAGGTYRPSKTAIPSNVRKPITFNIPEHTNTSSPFTIKTLLLELRFYENKVFTVGEKFPPFGVFLITSQPPSHYKEGKDDSNGCVLMLQNFKIIMNQMETLQTENIIKRKKYRNRTMSREVLEELLIVDLANSTPVPPTWNKPENVNFWELEIKSEIFNNTVLSQFTVPSFKVEDMSIFYSFTLELDAAIMNQTDWQHSTLQTLVEVKRRINPSTVSAGFKSAPPLISRFSQLSVVDTKVKEKEVNEKDSLTGNTNNSNSFLAPFNAFREKKYTSY